MISSMNVAMVSLTIGLSLIHIYQRCNVFVNDRQVDISVMGISLRSVMACFTLVWRLAMNLATVSLTIGRLTLRLWVYRYDRLWHAVPWSGGFNELGNGFVNDRQVVIAVMGTAMRSVMSCST